MLSEPSVVEQVLLHEHGSQRRHGVEVRARPHLEVEVGEVGRLGAHRVDDDHRAARVLADLLEDRAGPREAMRLVRVLADEDGDLAVLDVGPVRHAQHPADHPELAGLLLREGAGAVLDPERRLRRTGVGAAEVVPLPAAAVVEDRLAAVGVADRAEPLRDLGDRGVPVDLLERAVAAAAQRLS